MSFPDRTQFYLFGYPVSHSVTPWLHNGILRDIGKSDNHYSLCEISSIDDPKLHKTLHDPTFAGASATMPLKVSIMKLLDDITDEAKKIGSINTIFLERYTEGKEDGNDRVKFCGTNTDWIGIKNSLTNAMQTRTISNNKTSKAKASFIIGGGGTTRAAVYALATMGYGPIYLINRDPDETRDIIFQFPEYELIPLTCVDDWTEERARSVSVGIGAIPDIPPQTESEKMVYSVSERLFETCSKTHGKGVCTMLEMAYKPRRTTMLKIAESHGWTVLGGIESVLEQGFAQFSYWLKDKDSGEFYQLDENVKDSARTLIRGMDDVKSS